MISDALRPVTLYRWLDLWSSWVGEKNKCMVWFLCQLACSLSNPLRAAKLLHGE